MYRTLFVFIDGLGLGPPDTAVNPLAREALPAFAALAGGQRWVEGMRPLRRPDHVLHPIDATLGVEGLPQSGTGQAALFTGVNCAAVAGRHYGPFPHSQTKPVIAENNIFSRIHRLDLPHPEPAAFANAYPPRFFNYARARDRWTVTTRCCLDAGLRIRSLDALHARAALTADLTGQTWRDQLGFEVPLLSEAEAGERLYHISRSHAFTLFEYFITDKAGHSRSAEKAREVLTGLDRFFAGLLMHFDPASDLLVVTSDHGNIEDLSTKSHTMNAVPLLAYGRGAAFFSDVRDLTEVTPAVVNTLQHIAR